MKTPTKEQFLKWCKNHYNFALTVCEAQAYAEIKRKEVDAYILPIFQKYGFREDHVFSEKYPPSGELLKSPKDLYLCADPRMDEYYKECDQAHRKHGFDGPEGHCPALIAENLYIQAQNALLDAGEELTGVETCSLYGENRKKMLDLLIGACLNVK